MFTPITQLAAKLRRQPLAVGAGVVLWLGAVCVGWCMMTSYSYKTEQPTAAAFANAWPIDATLQRAAGHPTLVVFLHPKCPCSRATLSELERLANTPGARATAPKWFVVVSTPATADDSWESTPVVDRARQLPEAELVFDRGGALTARFGANVSGTVMYFNALGQRLYVGGVTSSRGHEGANAGTDALANLLANRPAAILALPVFGCRLVTAPRATPNDISTSDVARRNDESRN